MSIIAVTTSLVVAAPSGAQEQRQLRLGLAVHSDDPALVEAREAAIGRKLDVVRVFKLWSDPFPSADDLELLQGRDMILSIKPVRNGVKLKWADIANAQPGSSLYNEMKSWAQRMAPYEDRISITFHHEPEAKTNLSHGVANNFIDAWRHFMTVIKNEGFDGQRVWIMTDYSFQLPPSDRRYAPYWYPGDQWTDAIAGDAYNWYDCRNNADLPWLKLESIIEAMRVFGQAHPNEELMLTEFGSADDRSNSSRKGAWIDEARALFARPGYEQFTTISYFDLQQPGNSCNWKLDSSSSPLPAFRRLANDPLYGGSSGGGGGTTTTTGPSTTAPPSSSSVPPPSSGCTVTRANGTATLNWAATGGLDVIRRDGAWLATPPDNSTTYVDQNAPANADYIIRTWLPTTRVDIPCTASTGGTTTTQPATTTTQPGTTTTQPGTTTTQPGTTTTTTAPAAGCQVTREGNGNRITWVDDGGTHVLRRDGSWLDTPGSGVDTYLDTPASSSARYELRSWAGGARIDTPCN